MKRYDNPAGRLYSVLCSAPNADLVKQKCRDVWSRLLEIGNANDNVAIYRGIGLLLDQVDKAEELLQSIPDLDHSLYLQNFSALRNGIATPTLDAHWENQQRHLTAAVMRDLIFCAAKIAEAHSEGHLEGKDLEALATQIAELTERVTESSINKELRTVLLDLLEGVRRAIAEYRIRGAAGLREAMARSIGLVLLAWQGVSEPEEKETVSRVLEFLGKLDSILGRLMKYKPILVSIGRKLLPGAESIDDLAS